MRRTPFFGFTFEDLDKMLEDMLREMSSRMPEKLVRERKLPDGSTVRETGPIIYGYSMRLGPDGKPVIKEFGNVRPRRGGPIFGAPERSLEVMEKREPLTDVIDEREVIRVVAEVPGVDKSDIRLRGSERTLTISVDTEQRKYHKEVELPEEVDPESAKASYRNGVLEVTLKKRGKGPRGRDITVG